MSEMPKWLLMVRAICVGAACAALQPDQPESVIGTILLITAFALTRS